MREIKFRAWFEKFKEMYTVKMVDLQREIAYKILEELFPETKKIEIFARNERLGWDSFGDELGEIGGDEDVEV